MSDWLKELIEPEIRQYLASVTEVGLVLSKPLPKEAWSEVISRIAKSAGRNAHQREAASAWLGDLLNYGDVYGFSYRGQIRDFAQAAGFQEATLRLYKLVAGRIPPAKRHPELSWSHHVEVGRVFEQVEISSKWLEKAQQEGWSKSELRARIREARRTANAGKSTGSNATPVFRLMAELRLVDRVLQNHQPVWGQWTGPTRKGALSEIGFLAAFVDFLRTNADSSPSSSPKLTHIPQAKDHP
jgi:hypothetical protein